MGNFTAAETERCPSLTEEIEGFLLHLRVASILLDSRDRKNTFFSKSPQVTMENFTAAQPKQCPSLTEDKIDVKIIKILAYSIVFIVSLFGNSVIIATVMRNRRMQTTVNYLIANMAASDLFISVFAVPMKISEIVKCPRRWLIEGSKASTQNLQRNVKVIANICAIIIAFALCVLPLFVYGMLFYFVWKWEMPCNMNQFGFVVHFVLFSNAAITPLIYFVFNDKYRRGLQQVLKQVQFFP
ncbi:uncharacterized protein [Montipora foliosa]|uniref:uncharacterized protein n=1 Tax=Montipora foliosa TaxID=591990 RepID=UPI0035F0FFF5